MFTSIRNLYLKAAIFLTAAAGAFLAPAAEPRSAREILDSIPTPIFPLPYNMLTGPWVFSGYRQVNIPKFHPAPLKISDEHWPLVEGGSFTQFDDPVLPELTADGMPADSIPTDTISSLLSLIEMPADIHIETPAEKRKRELKELLENPIPVWLRDAIMRDRIAQNFMYQTMIQDPATIDYAYWELPVPPVLPEDDVSFANYIRKMDIPDIKVETDFDNGFIKGRRHWIHSATAGIQFSEAYVSSNWYQGGNNYLALLINLLWDVQLNQHYYPNKMMQSTVSYKLGLNSTPQDTHHSISFSEDLFQWNFKAGLKAFKNFYYSYTLQFKTQLFVNHETNSDARKASFLSPGDLNMGLGMTYNYTNKPKTFNLGISFSPLSYNLKTCIDKYIDPTQFNILVGHKTHSEVGSNLEANIQWAITSNIGCRARYFAFTDYQYFMNELETTFNFSINKFLSTQLYLHLRYDSSSDAELSKWKHWMLKEILSFGLTYTFSNKPS